MRNLLLISMVLIALGSFQNCSNAAFSAADSSNVATGTPGGDDASGELFQTLNFLQPAMAVRSANCINCHGNTMASTLITDFGFGDNYFFGKDNATPLTGDPVYSLRIDKDAGAFKPYWAEAQQYTNGAKIIVPKANLGFQYSTLAPAGTPMANWMYSTTLADLMTQIEALPGAGNTPVVEMNTMYIGAPSVSSLRAHGGLDSFHPLRYYPQSATSYPLSGLQLIGPAITNVGVVACDGDLFVDGSVFLNQLQLKTLTGCRIHATGPIFVQQAISYVADPGQLQKPNLQLVSARLISMGVGNSQCEASTDPSGWYNASGVASPTAMRFTYMPDPASVWFKDVRTRNTNPGSTYEKTAASPLAEGQAMLAIAQAIPGLQDASCHGRNVGFDHLFLVAPQIHSRYKGNFHGVIVTEFPMFSLGAFSYQFDPVFQTVPVLPKIPASEILVLK